ncbi:unnamed protein product [Calicophoron daubneyi]|uniref:AAA+ ATPase domain-containing protein n=1 Tax=Calicophoron daubneyi TaxID=300641 RepID=A0AAV2T3X9_CALDB
MERFYPNFYSYTKSHYEPLTPKILTRSESVATGLSDDKPSGLEMHSSIMFSKDGASVQSVQHVNGSPTLRPRMLSVDRVCRPSQSPSVPRVSKVDRFYREHSTLPGSMETSFGCTNNPICSADISWHCGPKRNNVDSSEAKEQLFIDRHLCPDVLLLPVSSPNFGSDAQCLSQSTETLTAAGNNSQNGGPALNRPVPTNLTQSCQGCLFPKTDSVQTNLMKKASLRSTNSERMGTSTQIGFIHKKSVRSPSPCISSSTANITRSNPTETLDNSLPGPELSAVGFPTIPDRRHRRLIETERIVRQELASTRVTGKNLLDTPSDKHKEPGHHHKHHHQHHHYLPCALKLNKIKSFDPTITFGSPLMGDSVEQSPPLAVVSPIRSESDCVHLSDESNWTGSLDKNKTREDPWKIADQNPTPPYSPENRAEHASEQNLENLTAKIQQLTTLNTMKDSEIRELRKTIDQLKNEVQKVHSSQRNGVGSMMRAPRSISCTHPDKTLQHGVQDSTSLTSLTSGVSGVSQDTNPGSTSSSGEAAEGHSPSPNPDTDANSGKRSRWIRSSIGKAFKKRSRSTMNADERTVVPDEQLVRQNSVAGSTATVCNSPILSRNSTSQLTDQSHTCSEALSYLSDNVDHGESLRNIMLRMRWEMNCLEADNQRLRRFVLNCPALTEPPSTGHRSNSRPVTISDLCNRYCSSSAEQRIRVLVELERPTITAAIELPQSTSETSSVLKSPVASNRVLGELGDGDRKTKTLKVGFVGLTREDGWENLDAAIVKLWEDYIKFFDPDQKLIPKPPKVTDYQLEAATQNSTTVAVIHHRLISEHEKEKRGDGSDKSHSHTRSPSLWLTRIKENNPNSSLGFIATLHIVSAPQQSDSGLDDGDHGSVGLDPPSLITLIPRKTLEDYLSQIKTHRFVVFCGPTGTGKSHAARKIAEYLTGRRTSSEAIRIFGASHNGFPTAKEMRLFLNRYLEAFRTNGVPQVIILENLHRVQGSVTEAVDAQGSSDFKSWPIVLATSDLRNDELQNLQSQFPIKIVDHLVDLDSSSEFLGRFLRRKLAQARMFEEADAPGAETAQREENNTLVQLVNWIPKVWKHINQLANLHQKQSPTVFGLKVFLACPIGVDSSKNWFMDLWNNLFVPFLFKARTSDAKVMESFSATLAESFDWIVATWPWPRTISDALLQSTDSTPTIESSTYSLLSLTAPKILGGRNDSHNRTSLDSGIMSDGLPSLGGQSSSNAAHFETKAPRESEHPETFLHETHLAEPMGPVYTHQTEVERISTDTSQQRPNTSSSSNRKRSLEMTDGHATFIPLPKEVFPPLVKSATLDSSISSTDKI